MVAVTNLVRTLKLLKEAGLWVVGADAEGAKLAHEVGSEGRHRAGAGRRRAGLRQLTRQTCDWMVRLPQLGAVESLNVSVAAGMLLYEAVRQRMAPATRGSRARDGQPTRGTPVASHAHDTDPPPIAARPPPVVYPSRPLSRTPKADRSPCRTPQRLATGGSNP